MMHAHAPIGKNLMRRLHHHSLRAILTFARFIAVVILVLPASAWAIEELITEEDISDLIVHSNTHAGKQTSESERQWAVLPQLGYGPDTGPVVGVKYTHRNLFD